MSTVKVSNKTKDAKGPLAQFRLVNVDLEVCGQMVAPGSSVVVPTEDWELQKFSYARLIKLGALEAEAVVDAPKEPGPGLVDTKTYKKKKDDFSTEG